MSVRQPAVDRVEFMWHVLAALDFYLMNTYVCLSDDCSGRTILPLNLSSKQIKVKLSILMAISDYIAKLAVIDVLTPNTTQPTQPRFNMVSPCHLKGLNTRAVKSP